MRRKSSLLISVAFGIVFFLVMLPLQFSRGFIPILFSELSAVLNAISAIIFSCTLYKFLRQKLAENRKVTICYLVLLGLAHGVYSIIFWSSRICLVIIALWLITIGFVSLKKESDSKTTHHMQLNPRPFELIASGEKTIELRLNDPKRQAIRVGDLIVFTNASNEDEKLTTRVIALHSFANFAQLYAGIPLEKCGYSPAELATASPKDMEAYYTPAQQAQYGVLGIEIQVI